MNTPTKAAFTLIELLVVVTIIVVLLALLTPAMDKAVYQAELAVCGARQKVIATSVLMYAHDNHRHYPYRPAMTGSNSNPDLLWNGVGGANADDRAYIHPYMSLNDAFNEPLTDKVDFANAKIGSFTYASYFLWYGFTFTGNSGMKKIGDRLSWTEDGEGHSFSVLATDNDDIRFSKGNVFNGHPDYDGKLTSHSYQDQGGVPVGIGPVGGALTYVLSRWDSTGSIYRGGEDMNYVYDDGSVRRVTDVRLNSVPDPDERLVKVGSYNGDTETVQDWAQLPRE